MDRNYICLIGSYADSLLIVNHTAQFLPTSIKRTPSIKSIKRTLKKVPKVLIEVTLYLNLIKPKSGKYQSSALKHTYQLHGMASTLHMRTTIPLGQWQPSAVLRPYWGSSAWSRKGQTPVSKTLYCKGECKSTPLSASSTVYTCVLL